MSRKHAHYFKDVAHLDEVDVYRVCDIFAVNDPSGATQHAIKKLLLPGQRGAGKDRIKDLKEARDTIDRRMEMYEEDLRNGEVKLCAVPLKEWPLIVWAFDNYSNIPARDLAQMLAQYRSVIKQHPTAMLVRCSRKRWDLFYNMASAGQFWKDDSSRFVSEFKAIGETLE